MNRQLSHTDADGRARMVDVSGKPPTARRAVARGEIRMLPETLALISSGQVPKGDALGVARLAGIQAAKCTWQLIPLCHPLLTEDVQIELVPMGDEGCVRIEASVAVRGPTGPEMEALSAVALAALTLYDMCKAVDPSLRIENIRLVRKSGGRSGTVVREG